MGPGWRPGPSDPSGARTVESHQQAPPPSTRKKLSMSASVPMSPSALKSALAWQGAAGQAPARHEKKASMSASVPTSPSQLKSALPQEGGGGGGGQGSPLTPVS